MERLDLKSTQWLNIQRELKIQRYPSLKTLSKTRSSQTFQMLSQRSMMTDNRMLVKLPASPKIEKFRSRTRPFQTIQIIRKSDEPVQKPLPLCLSTKTKMRRHKFIGAIT